MDLENIIIISIIIEVITLICFFALCKNIASIKKSIATSDNLGAVFNFYLSIGQKEKAIDLLIKSIINDPCFNTAFFSNTAEKENAQKKLLKKYRLYLEAINLKIDFDKANDFISAHSNS